MKMKKILKVVVLGIVFFTLANQIIEAMDDNFERQEQIGKEHSKQIDQNRLDSILSDGVIDETEKQEYEELTKDF